MRIKLKELKLITLIKNFIKVKHLWRQLVTHYRLYKTLGRHYNLIDMQKTQQEKMYLVNMEHSGIQ